MVRQLLAVAVLFGTTCGVRAGAEQYFEERVKDFGTVPRGPTLTHYFRITNTTNQNVIISGARVSCGCTSATIAVAQLKPGESTAVTAQMDTRRFYGHKAVTIYVTFSAPQFEEVTLRVQANSRDDFSMTPDTLAIGTVRSGKEGKASVKMSLFDPTWEVSNATCDSNYVKPVVKLVTRSGSDVAYEVTAVTRPDLPVGKWFTDVWVQTNNAAMPKVRIPLTVEVTPAVVATPNVLQFGEVKVGSKGEQKLIVRGDKPFKILEVQGIDGVLTVAGKNDEAKPVHILTFTFKPDKAGDVSRALKVSTDDGQTDITVPLRASAVPE